jgi:hypothetical protein
MLPVSVGIMLTAVILYVTAMIKLDGLTMPKRFWREDPNALGPRKQGLLNEDDLWELHHRMIFWWFRLVIVGTALTAASLLAMLLPVGLGEPPANLPGLTMWSAGGGILAAIVYLLVIFMIAKRRFSPLVRPLD